MDENGTALRLRILEKRFTLLEIARAKSAAQAVVSVAVLPFELQQCLGVCSMFGGDAYSLPHLHHVIALRPKLFKPSDSFVHECRVLVVTSEGKKKGDDGIDQK